MSNGIIINETFVWALVEFYGGWGQPRGVRILSVHMTREDAAAEDYHLEQQGTHGITDVMPACVKILEGTGE